MTSEHAIDLAVACARELFGLTTTEAHVLRSAVLEPGVSHAELARRRGVHADTIRSQAGDVCRRMNARTRR